MSRKESEVECYALSVPTDEAFMWIHDEKVSNLIKTMFGKTKVGIYQTIEKQYFLFLDKESRNDFYKAIHDVLPNSLLAYELKTAYVDRKYFMMS